MTTRIYIRARDPQNGRRLVEELIADGVDPDALTLIGKQVPDGLPVHRRRWLDDSSAALRGALVSAGVVLAVSLLFQVLEPWALLALVVIAAAMGGGWWVRRNRRANLPLSAQREAMQGGDLLIAADLPDTEAPRVEERVSQRHPELLVLGPDAGGSPPFP